jgi:hypothetical protein
MGPDEYDEGAAQRQKRMPLVMPPMQTLPDQMTLSDLLKMQQQGQIEPGYFDKIKSLLMRHQQIPNYQQQPTATYGVRG